jgi:group I intron endonuclease
MKCESGIYKIENNINHKIYVGQSKNIHNRMLQHRSELRRRKHINSHLQMAVDKYGLDNFSFIVIEKCPIGLLDEREVYWIEKLQSANKKYGYNSSLGGQAHRLVSEATRKLMRKNFEGEKSRTAKISEDTAKQIVQMLLSSKSIHGIAKELGISHKIVEGIRTKKKWKYLTEDVDFPQKRSTKYKWVSVVPNTTYPLYRAIVKVDGKKIYDKSWDSAYDAAVARELFIRKNKINACRNFANDVELQMPTKKRYATSKYYGLTKEVGCYNRWVVQFRIKGKMYYIGTFPDEETAVIARENYIDKHFPNANLKRNILERTVETTNSPLNA